MSLMEEFKKTARLVQIFGTNKKITITRQKNKPACPSIFFVPCLVEKVRIQKRVSGPSGKYWIN